MAKIMVVDNNKNLRYLYQKELSYEGHEVTTVPSKEDALEALDTTKFDLIVSELQYPFFACSPNFSDFYTKDMNLKVIINTAYQTQPFRTWQKFVDAWITKSSDVEVLKRTIREVLN
ncbi:response regulator [candidate division KSB1 bacterium]|nr:response regulator [candidate division KSB1 bacterium]